ncbi:DUF3267 domain-containing protein [Candidatus Roizmanbacteria bacterium]|nr:DUF3267 domain-containing protein [Candidatus Roizmanbacteria bacterium]
MIPGWLISLVTFPGVIMHEIAHRFFCDIAKVPVYRVCYFRIGNPAGYVIHGPVKGLKNSFLISIGPLIVNTIFCSLLTFAAAFPILILDDQRYSLVFLILMWVGFSIGMHAFPSNDDMENFLGEVKQTNKQGLLVMLATVFARLLRLANLLRFLWFDAIYAYGVAMILPSLISAL